MLTSHNIKVNSDYIYIPLRKLPEGNIIKRETCIVFAIHLEFYDSGTRILDLACTVKMLTNIQQLSREGSL